MNTECLRIADQLRRAFLKDAWHGPAILDLLDDVSPGQAQARPLPSAHTIGELVLHIDYWLLAALEAARGTAMPKFDGGGADWPALPADSEAWFAAQDRLFRNAAALVKAIEQLDDAKLSDTVPGRSYDFYRLLHGVVQHSCYHGGQIAMLKKAVLDS